MDDKKAKLLIRPYLKIQFYQYTSITSTAYKLGVLQMTKAANLPSGWGVVTEKKNIYIYIYINLNPDSLFRNLVKKQMS